MNIIVWFFLFVIAIGALNLLRNRLLGRRKSPIIRTLKGKLNENILAAFDENERMNSLVELIQEAYSSQGIRILVSRNGTEIVLNYKEKQVVDQYEKHRAYFEIPQYTLPFEKYNAEKYLESFKAMIERVNLNQDKENKLLWKACGVTSVAIKVNDNFLFRVVY
jgi:hypothetical protein